jgi:hypothetical protein
MGGMRTFFKVTGLFFVGLILVGLFAKVILAALAGKAFYGENVYGLPLGTYSTLCVLVVAAVIGAMLGFRWVLATLKRHADEHPPPS